MTGSFSDYFENIVLDTLTGKNPSATRYIALATATITDTTTGSTIVEPSGSNYARKSTVAGDWNSASGGATDNANDIDFGTATEDWGNCTHAAICDALTGGNILAWVEIDTAGNILNGNSFKISVGDLDIRLD